MKKFCIMKALMSLFLALVCNCFVIGQDTLRDVDGNKYKTVKIGTQVWMLENLNVSHYNNGDIIPQVQDSTKWRNLKTGAWCYYEYKSGDHKVKGKMYNYYAIADPRGLIPKGYKIAQNWNDWSKVNAWLHEGRESWQDDDTNKIKQFMGSDLLTVNCGKNPSYYRLANGRFGSLQGIGLWWLPGDHMDMSYYISRCTGMDGSYFYNFDEEAWKNYGFFIRCYKE